MRELTGKRTAYAKYFPLSDGGVQAEISGSPVHYRDTKGTYRPIDTRVTDTDRPGFVKANTSNTFTSLFGDSSDRLVRFEMDGRWVEIGLVADPRPVEPVVKGSTFTYWGVAGGVEVVYEVTATALKEQIVLHDAPAAGVRYRFAVGLGGLAPTRLRDGSIAFLSPTGRSLFAMPAPFMFDAHRDASSPVGFSWTKRVTQSLGVAPDGTTTVTVTPDSDWLRSGKRRYPVVVDPTVKIQPDPTDGQDTQIYSGSTGSNYNSSYQLKVGTTASYTYRSLVKFSLASVPSGTTLTSAKLSMYYDQTHTTYAYSVPMEARRVTGSWQEDTATWANIATSYAEAGNSGATKTANVSSVWNTSTVTNIVQSWLNGTNPNYGFMVKATEEATKGRGGPIYEGAEYAYQNTGRADNYPKLVLTWGRAGVTLNPPTTLTATGAALSWSSYVDPSTSPDDDIVEYQVHRSIYQAFQPSAATLVAPVAAGTTSYQDTSATPTPADSTDPLGRYYYHYYYYYYYY